MLVTQSKQTKKWRIGKGKYMYRTKKDAERAGRAYYASKYSKKKRKQ